jgi:hypothetical protein
MDTTMTPVTRPLYHGTRNAAARLILREGFRRSRSRNYTGTGICLSESITIAYEYGMYETGGCVLEARLSPSTRWTDRFDDKTNSKDAWDDFFVHSAMDAIRSFSGNVWVVWTPGVLVSLRRLSHRAALQRLCNEFDEDGPECGYNALVSHYASIWWKQDGTDAELARFPDHHRQLMMRLKRFVGRIHSTKAWP